MVRVVDRACRVAGRRLQEQAPGPLDRVVGGAAVPAPASDREQHPLRHPRREARLSVSCLVRDRRDAAPPRRRLAVLLWASDSDRGDLREPGALRGHDLRGRQLALSRRHQGLCPPQRPLHRPPRRAQAALCLSPAPRCPPAAQRAPPAARKLGAQGPRRQGAERTALALPGTRRDRGLPPRPGAQAQRRNHARGLYPRKARQHARSRRRRRVCEQAGAAGTGSARRLEEPEDRPLRAGLEVDPAPGHRLPRPRADRGGAATLLDAETEPWPCDRARRQAHSRRQPQRRGPPRDRDPGRSRNRRAARKPRLQRLRRRDRGRVRAARRGSRRRPRDHHRRASHHPRHRAHHQGNPRRRLSH